MKRKMVPTSPKASQEKESLEEQALEKIYKEDLQEIRKPLKQVNVVLLWVITIILGAIAGAGGFVLFNLYGDRLPQIAQFLPANQGEKEVIVREVVTTNEEAIALDEVINALDPVTVLLFPKELTNKGSLSEIYTDFDRRGMGVILTSDGWAVAPTTAFQDVDYVAVTHDGSVYNITSRVDDTATNVTYFQFDAKNLSVVQLLTGENPAKNGLNVWVAEKNPSQTHVSLTPATLGSPDSSVLANDADYLRSTEEFSWGYGIDFQPTKDILGAPVVGGDNTVVGLMDRVVSEDGIQWFVRNALDWQSVTTDVLTGKGVNRSVLGLRYLDLSESIGVNPRADSKRAGAYLVNDTATKTQAVKPGSPAADAELKSGDIITQVNEVELTADNNLTQMVQSKNPGDEISLTVLRGKAELTVRVTLD